MINKESIRDVGIFIAICAIAAAAKYYWPSRPMFEVIRDKQFRDTRVEIDGKDFVNCTFENVTFIFEGKGAVRFSAAVVRGTVMWDSNVLPIKRAMILMTAIDRARLP